MAKQIGRGIIIDAGSTTGRLETDCMNGSTTSLKRYGFDMSETDDELFIDDRVLFVEDTAPFENNDGVAINVVKLPASGECL